MISHVRFHGRGGEGVKLASRIVSRAAFLAGRSVQDSPLYGAERRGAPVVAFVRVADAGPIADRGYIERPDAVVVMDDSLLPRAEAGVLDGVSGGTLVLVNTRHTPEELRARFGIAGRVVALDVSGIALALLGRHVLSAPAAGFTVKATGLTSWDEVARAVETELADVGLAADAVGRNLAATRRAFDAAPFVGLAPPGAPPTILGARALLGRFAPCGPTQARLRRAPPDPVGRHDRSRGRPAEPAVAPRHFVVPRLPARVAAPSVLAPGSSALRTTAGWRVSRPVVDLGRCTRCFLCFALCPEGAISLDGESWPVVDYDHCKGCLVCVTECPPRAITEIREPQA